MFSVPISIALLKADQVLVPYLCFGENKPYLVTKISIGGGDNAISFEPLHLVGTYYEDYHIPDQEINIAIDGYAEVKIIARAQLGKMVKKEETIRMQFLKLRPHPLSNQDII